MYHQFDEKKPKIPAITEMLLTPERSKDFCNRFYRKFTFFVSSILLKKSYPQYFYNNFFLMIIKPRHLHSIFSNKILHSKKPHNLIKKDSFYILFFVLENNYTELRKNLTN